MHGFLTTSPSPLYLYLFISTLPGIRQRPGEGGTGLASLWQAENRKARGAQTNQALKGRNWVRKERRLERELAFGVQRVQWSPGQTAESRPPVTRQRDISRDTPCACALPTEGPSQRLRPAPNLPELCRDALGRLSGLGVVGCRRMKSVFWAVPSPAPPHWKAKAGQGVGSAHAQRGHVEPASGQTWVEGSALGCEIRRGSSGWDRTGD